MGNKELQKEAAVFLESLGRELVHYPYTNFYYIHWSNISAIVKGSDPAELLRQIRLYPISPSGYGMHDIVSDFGGRAVLHQPIVDRRYEAHPRRWLEVFGLWGAVDAGAGPPP